MKSQISRVVQSYQLKELLLKVLKNEDTSSELEIAREKYGDDVDLNDLIAELNIKVLFKDKDINHFHDIIKKIKLIDNAETKLIVNICTICKISAVNPASSSTAEITFSMARTAKTRMQSNMLHARFNSVAMLNFNKKRLDCLDVIVTANLFPESKDNRKSIFGKFTEKDLKNNNNKLFYLKIPDIL